MSTPEIILTKNVPETLVCLTAEDGVYYCDEAPHLAVIPLRPRSDSTTSPSSSSPSSARSAGPARKHSTQHVLRQRQKHGAHPGVSKVQKHSKPSKDSFRELSGVDLPPAISLWANANETVDVHSNRFLSERPDHHTYAFPPPSLFLKANPARQNAYFSQNDHLHDALIFRVESAFAGNTNLRPQEWRDILSLSFVDDANGEAKGFVDARRLLGECFERWGVALELVPTQPVSLTALQRKELLWNYVNSTFGTSSGVLMHVSFILPLQRKLTIRKD
ncbi:hypothetical protein K435DRAFT_872586 [Dendrothele bispora CBS 962.96]|uniref:Uncharacterized protein n=1 Tax=Dendrothele bispora (strain CBS 962.96) TaxID=1314807 RepID=A0A4S8L183_DENBC|nr:hypothetical protein K435DRAFT_872586 [Dendrothele bispora CBS 962.96]